MLNLNFFQLLQCNLASAVGVFAQAKVRQHRL